MIHFIGINLNEKTKTSEMVTIFCGVKNIHFHVPRFLVLYDVESHQRFLLLVDHSVLGVLSRQLNLVKDLPSLVIYQRNIVLFIHLPVLNKPELDNIIMTNNLMIIVQVITGVNMIKLLINNSKNGAWESH